MDRIEKEINDILKKLDDFPGEQSGAPVSLDEHRKQRRKAPRPNPGRGPSRFMNNLNPATLLLTGAGMVVGGLLLSAFAGWLIWVAFAGILVFFFAFALSFWDSGRTSRTGAGGGTGPGGRRAVFWRDRYIEYEPQEPGVVDRVKRWIRRP